MNEKFYALPPEKQARIINAGFRVFARNSYKKSPVSEIADAAGISKALLFHYFRNKHELYLFLWDKCAELTLESVKSCGAYEADDIFDAMLLGMRGKLRLMREFPDISAFAVKAYYEEDEEIRGEITGDVNKRIAQVNPRWLDPARLRPGIDPRLMYRDMYLAGEGFVWEFTRRGALSADEMEREFSRLIEFWRGVYSREGTNESD